MVLTIDIYIMMAHDIKIFFFYMKYLMINIDELQIIKLLKELFIEGLFPHTNVSKFHLLSYLTPSLFPITDTLEGFLE